MARNYFSLHAKGAKAAKESTKNEALSPTQVCPKQCLPKQPRQPMLSFHDVNGLPAETSPGLGHKLLSFFASLAPFA